MSEPAVAEAPPSGIEIAVLEAFLGTSERYFIDWLTENSFVEVR